MNSTVYIKCEKNTQVGHQEVKISDIASVFCEDKSIAMKVKAIRVVKIPDNKHRRYVVSILKIVELIVNVCPGVVVKNEGDSDIIIEYRRNVANRRGEDNKAGFHGNSSANKKRVNGNSGKNISNGNSGNSSSGAVSKIADIAKTIFVGLITLLGGSFAIMAYNNDVSSAELLSNIYTLVLGEGADGHMILEIAYSVGLALGIIIFYGHFGNWKFGKLRKINSSLLSYILLLSSN